MPDKFLHQYEIMLTKANADLKLAIYALKLDDAEIDMDIIFFHLQQAAEKYLKALLSFKGIHYEEVHDIGRLLGLCQANGIMVPEYAGQLVELNPYAVEGRYAVIADEMEDAGKYIALLENLRTYIKEQIGHGGSVK